MTKKIFLITVFLFFSYNVDAKQKNVVIVVPSYNNELWCKQNLDSIFSQEYTNFRVIYINDASKDKTGELVIEYLTEHNLWDKCCYIENKENKGALYNIYHAVHSCDDDEIIVLVDGDDWLNSEWVLSRVTDVYEKQDVWLTYGEFINNCTRSKGCCGVYEEEVIVNSSFRDVAWRASHLRTFYAKLFKYIRKEDFMCEGKFFKVSWDMAIMFPLLEMAQNRFRFISDVLYVYNMVNPLNDFKLYEKEQLDVEAYIRKMPRYKRLDRL